jgi:spermidine synthase
MTSVAVPITNSGARLRFTVAIFAGSFLLFLVQPMIARMALPRLGGAPAVWNSAMLVYQTLLLGGYAYAHALTRLPPRTQGVVHCAVLAVAALMLPIGLGVSMPPIGSNPFFWVPWLLLTSIGPLFFAISAQAPLLQRWYSLAGGGDPYPLYAASNLGSFSGLIAYPLIVEPLLPVNLQSLGWSAAYAILAVLVALCALTLPRDAVNKANTATGSRPSLGSTVKWIALAAIPSGLMLSTSLHLTTDIVAMPLLWVVPLGVYLLSFTIAFSENRAAATAIGSLAPLLLLIAACGVFVDATFLPWVFAAAAVASLFAVSVALHGKLYESRPEPEQATAFYLALSIGGVVGGIFCALVAPLIFDWTYEHPILIAAAALALPQKPLFAYLDRYWSRHAGDTLFQAFLIVLVLAISLLGQGLIGLPYSKNWSYAVTSVLLIAGLLSIGNRQIFAAVVVALMLSLSGWSKIGLSLQEGRMTRSFFGVYSIRDSGTNARYLVHGTTIHGIQNLGSPLREMLATSYYAPRSGVGLALTAAPLLYGPHARIGIVGLGTGTLSCYHRRGQDWRFFEIDPAIERIARDPLRFTFLARCLPDAKILIGDARLVLAAQPPAGLDILVVDAFSSDSVPVHLLTQEAFENYRDRLSSDGLLMVHISNRYLDLEPIVAAAAKNGWTARIRKYSPSLQSAAALNYFGSNWIAMSPSPTTVQKLIERSNNEPWEKLRSDSRLSIWTDNHASILPIIKWKRD